MRSIVAVFQERERKKTIHQRVEEKRERREGKNGRRKKEEAGEENPNNSGRGKFRNRTGTAKRQKIETGRKIPTDTGTIQDEGRVLNRAGRSKNPELSRKKRIRNKARKGEENSMEYPRSKKR